MSARAVLVNAFAFGWCAALAFTSFTDGRPIAGLLCAGIAALNGVVVLTRVR